MRSLPVCLALLFLSCALSSTARAEKPYLIPPASPSTTGSAEAPTVREAPTALPATPRAIPGAPLPALQLEPSLLAFRELSLLQQRERQLWQEHGEIHLGGPIAAIAVGLPVFLAFFPIGVVFIGDSAGYEDDITLAIGRGFTAAGVLGLLSMTVGAVRVAQLRRRRAEQERELRSIGERRGLLERALSPFGEGLRF
jgi:hypothetical protein